MPTLVHHGATERSRSRRTSDLPPWRRRVRQIRGRLDWPLRVSTSPLRALPDFLIIGAMKAGTTSLYDYLSRHPDVLPAKTKEVQFFNPSPDPPPLRWYRAHFPTRHSMKSARARGRPVITGEATPSYLLYPHTPEWISEQLPEGRFIAVLRDPVERALSHYRHSRALGKEELDTFEAALDAEPTRLAGEWQKILADPAYSSPTYGWYSYAARGHYLPQLQRWHDHVDRDRLLVITAEALDDDTAGTVDRVLAFLGLEPFDPGPRGYPRRNPARDTTTMEDATRERLRTHFAPRNAELAAYLGMDLPWQ